MKRYTHPTLTKISLAHCHLLVVSGGDKGTKDDHAESKNFFGESIFEEKNETIWVNQ